MHSFVVEANWHMDAVADCKNSNKNGSIDIAASYLFTCQCTGNANATLAIFNFIMIS